VALLADRTTSTRCAASIGNPRAGRRRAAFGLQSASIQVRRQAHANAAAARSAAPAHCAAVRTHGTNRALNLTLPITTAARHHRAAVQSNEVYPPP